MIVRLFNCSSIEFTNTLMVITAVVFAGMLVILQVRFLVLVSSLIKSAPFILTVEMYSNPSGKLSIRVKIS